MKFLPEKSQPETRKEVVQLYVYFVLFLAVFLIALWYEENLPLTAFLISATAKIMENMLSEAWQLGKQKKSDKQEEINLKLDELLSRTERRAPLSPSLPYEDDPNNYQGD